MRQTTIFLFLCVFGLNSASAQNDTLSYNFEPMDGKNYQLSIDNEHLSNKIDSMIAFAKDFMGLKYRYGNNTPAGFDCSGFTNYVFSQFGYKLGRSSSDQYKDGILVSKENMKPGDLVFFQEKNRNGTYRINHVGMIISVDTTAMTFHFIHSCRRGVLIDHSEMEYYQKRFYGIRRIVEEDEN